MFGDTFIMFIVSSNSFYIYIPSRPGLSPITPCVRRKKPIDIGQNFSQLPMSISYDGYMVNNKNITCLGHESGDQFPRPEVPGRVPALQTGREAQR